MDSEPLISIVTPCYNGEKHLNRFLDSILNQTYKHIELILVNDGSTDKTEEIVFSYKEKFENSGILLVYISQENKGLGGAINSGLRKVTGRYICWPDADDFLAPESIEMRLQILENNQDYSIVTSDAWIQADNISDIKPVLASEGFTDNDNPNQFGLLLSGKSFVCSGCYMVRTSVFFDTHPTGEINPDRRGQNYQMLLPIYYLHKRYFLNKPLYYYIRHQESMSHIESKNTKEKLFAYKNQQITLRETLYSIPMSENERNGYLNLIDARFSKIIFNIAYNSNDYDLIKVQYSNLKSLNSLTIKIIIRNIVFRLRRLFFISK